MDSSTFQPPIHLDPSQEDTQQLAFINQNFQAIASTLETNSFRIVKSDTATIASTGATVSYTTVPHNLGYAPVPFAFLLNQTVSTGTSIISTDANIPLPTFTNATIDTIKGTATNSGNPIPIFAFSGYLEVFCDDMNFYVLLYNATGGSIPTHTIGYYLVQKAVTA